MLDIFQTGSVTAQNDFGFRGVSANQLRHMDGFIDIGDYELDPHVIVALFDFRDKPAAGRKIQDGRGDFKVFGNQLEAVRFLVKSHGENALFPGHLVMEDFHQIFLTAIGVIHAVRTKNGG